MKKLLPIIIFVVAVIFLIVVFFVIRGRNSTSTNTDDEQVAELAFENRPFVTLSPTKAAANGQYGHWLTLDITNVNVPGATTLDYLLEYQTGDGGSQGVPGSGIKLDGQNITRDLLLGSESAGKFRYDEGVQNGTLTIRFRSAQGKLVGKLTTDFHLQTGTADLTSADGNFTFTLAKSPAAGIFFVTLDSFGLPAGVTSPGTVKSGPYTVMSSDGTKYAGTVQMGDGKYYRIDGTTITEVASGSETTIGTFVSI